MCIQKALRTSNMQRTRKIVCQTKDSESHFQQPQKDDGCNRPEAKMDRYSAENNIQNHLFIPTRRPRPRPLPRSPARAPKENRVHHQNMSEYIKCSRDNFWIRGLQDVALQAEHQGVFSSFHEHSDKIEQQPFPAQNPISNAVNGSAQNSCLEIVCCREQPQLKQLPQ